MKIMLSYLLAAAMSTAIARNPMFDETARFYDYASWRGVSKETYVRLIYDYDLPTLSLPTNSWPVEVSIRPRRNGRREIFLFSRNDQDLLLRINSLILTNVVTAQDSLINHFAGCPVRMNNLTTNNIGDRGYGAINANMSFSVFARNNIFVSVGSGTNAIPADSVARQIDADILQRSRGN